MDNKIMECNFNKDKNPSKEKIVMEAKLEGGADPKSFKINENQAVVEIAKSLIQDFTFTITMQVIKIVLGNVKNADKLLDAIKDVWLKRTSAQLSDEYQKYQDAISAAFSSEKDVSEETSKKIEKYMQSYCYVRDKAVETAKGAIDDIIKSILEKPEEKNNEENK